MKNEILKPFYNKMVCRKGEHKGLEFYTPLQQAVDEPTWDKMIFTQDYVRGYCKAIRQVRDAISCLETKPELEAVFNYTVHLMELFNKKLEEESES